MENISDLNLDVDISVASPDDYADNTTPVFPMGTFNFRLIDLDLDRDRATGQVKLTKSGFPTILLKSIRVADGEHEGKTLTYQRVYSTKYQRTNREGKKVEVSQLGDLIRAIDTTATWSTIGDALNLLRRAKDMNLTFRASVNWEAFDTDYYNRLVQERNITQLFGPEDKQARKEATLSGRKHFSTGSPNVIGPSGKALTARPVLSNFYASRD